MIESKGGEAGTPGAAPQVSEDLPFRVEIREDGAERILARASSAALARAIFKAAIEENPGRRIVLLRGENVVEDSAK